jgi:FkbM family methyltransferase
MPALTAPESLAPQALQCFISYNRYGAYCVPLSSQHRPAAQMIRAGAVYEPGTIEFLQANCGQSDLVHAGTYFGDFLPALSRACSPQSRVWAFEPSLENYRCAHITILLNELRNIELANAGLGERREMLRLLTTDKDGVAQGGASRVVSVEDRVAGRTEPVQIVTIDDTIPYDRPVSIIQLDVEGHEQQALIGALRTIERCRPIIMVEILAGSTLLNNDWLAQHIIPFGYVFAGSIHGNAVFRCDAASAAPS